MKEPVKWEKDDPFTVFRVVRNTSPMGSPLRFFEFKSITRKLYNHTLMLRPDIIIAHDIYTLDAGSLAARRLGVPLLYDTHEDWPELIGENSRMERFAASRMQERWLNRCVSGVVAPCETIAGRFRTDTRRSIVLVNAREAEEFDAPMDKPPKPIVFTVGYVGSMEQLLKGDMIGKLLQVMIQFGRQELPVELHITGGPKESADAIRQQVENSYLSESVIVRGPVPTEELWGVYDQMDLGLVMLDKRQTFIDSLPNKVFDYMANGVPMLYPLYCHEIDHIVEFWRCGWPWSGSAEDLASAIQSIMKMDHRAAGIRGERAFLSAYAWEHQEPTFLRLVHGLLDEAQAVTN
jgi:hypothetical protein